MKVRINTEAEPVVEAALRSGRYASADDFVADAIRDKVAVDRTVDENYVRLADAALKAGGFQARTANWRQDLERLAQDRRLK